MAKLRNYLAFRSPKNDDMTLTLLIIYFLIKKINRMNYTSFLKWIGTFSIIMIPAFFLTSCDSTTSIEEEQTTQQGEEISMTDVKQDMVETYETFENYLYDQKETMVEKANKRIEKIDREIEAMEQKMSQQAVQLEDSIQQQTNATLNELKRKKEKLSKKLDQLENSTSEAWDVMKDGFSDALKELEESLDKAGETMKG